MTNGKILTPKQRKIRNEFEISGFGKILTPKQRLAEWKKVNGPPRDANEMEEVLSGKTHAGPRLLAEYFRLF